MRIEWRCEIYTHLHFLKRRTNEHNKHNNIHSNLDSCIHNSCNANNRGNNWTYKEKMEISNYNLNCNSIDTIAYDGSSNNTYDSVNLMSNKKARDITCLSLSSYFPEIILK